MRLHHCLLLNKRSDSTLLTLLSRSCHPCISYVRCEMRWTTYTDHLHPGIFLKLSLESKYEGLCVTLTPIFPRAMSSFFIFHNSMPHTHMFFYDFLFTCCHLQQQFHTQIHGCCSMNHLSLPEKDCMITCKLGSPSQRSLWKPSQQLQVTLQSPDVTSREVLLPKTCLQQISVNGIDM